MQGFEHFDAADGFGRKEFDGVEAVFECQHEFARAGNAGDDGDVGRRRRLGEGRIDAGADGEHRARFGYGFELGGVDDGARADDGGRYFPLDAADGFDGGGRTQGDFEYADAAIQQCLRQSDRGLRVVDGDDGDDGAGGQDFARCHFGFLIGWCGRRMCFAACGCIARFLHGAGEAFSRNPRPSSSHPFPHCR